jgi:outer membrane protein TolC
VTEEVFRTVLSYLNLVAAQQTVTQLEASAVRQAQILTLSEARVNAGELAQADLARVRASAAGVDGTLAQARTALVTARVALAEQMGINIADLQGAPLAAQGFAAGTPTDAAVDTLIARALATRHDVRAAAARREAAGHLFAGARANARPRLDLTLTGGIYNLYDSPFFKFLPDEGGSIICAPASPLDDEGNCGFPAGAGLGIPTPPVTGSPVPPLDPVRYYDPTGYGRAIKNRHTPFVTIGLTIELPFGNNAAKGRVAQAQATLSSAEIESQDLRRVIGESVVELVGTVRRSAAALAQWESTVASDAETLDGRIRMFQLGDATLIDALLTEEGLTGDHLQLIRQRQAYLSALARLKYELGELVEVDENGAATGTLRFDAGSFASQ